MLGDKIGEGAGKVTVRRVLAGPKVETSFQSSGTLLGVKAQELGTYTSVMRPDGTVYGEGQGVLMGAGGEQAAWVGQGVGKFGKDGAISYRGAIYYQTTAGAWSRLNSVAGVFEYEVDAAGNTKAQIWEWK
jgi:hypothetical protein